MCDIDDAAFKNAVEGVEKTTGKAPRTEKDFHRLLDDKNIDAIAIATPDHWHSLLTVFGCQAGKDVYCEKPASHNVVEGRRMVQAARKYNRVVQLGTQRRSAPHVKEAVEYLKSGGIGQVALARAWIHQHLQDRRGERRSDSGPHRHRLRHVARPCARSAVHQEPVLLQLALVLELGDRRVGEQRRPRGRCGPLGAGRG